MSTQTIPPPNATGLVTRPSRSDPFVARALNRLIQRCKDGEKGYGAAAADVSDESLKSTLENLADQRAQFAGALQHCVRSRGRAASSSGTVRGAILRSWNDLIASVVGVGPERVLAGRERSDDRTRADYESALRQGLPPSVEAVLRQQLSAIRAARAQMRYLQRREALR